MEPEATQLAPHVLLGGVLVMAGLGDLVAVAVLAGRLEGNPNRNVVLLALGSTAFFFLAGGAALASGLVPLG